MRVDGGRSGDEAQSIVNWKRTDCPVKKEPTSTRDHEAIAVRRYLENITTCRRVWLLDYFDPSCSEPKKCDVCTLK